MKMFSFFKPKPAYPVDCKWSVGSFQADGKQFFLRRNDSAKILSGCSEYRFRVGVAIPVSSLDENCIPTPDEAELIMSIEDALTTTLEANQDSIHVLAISCDSMREFIFYTRRSNEVRFHVERISKQFPSCQIQFYIAEDRNWECYEQYA